MDGIFDRLRLPSFSMAAPNTWEKLFSLALDCIEVGTLTVKFPSGNKRVFSGNNPMQNELVADMTIHSWSAVTKALKGRAIGLAEGYMAGEWSTEDLTSVLCVFAANVQTMYRRLPLMRNLRFLERMKHFMNRNTRRGSRRNIEYHYDLGNDFYELWLDNTMTYSSAYFENPAFSLSDAQQAKYRHLAEMVGVKKGDHILEIGCGWGGFAEYAVKELDCHVTGLTLSNEQLAYAEERLARLGAADRAEFLLKDYRDMEGQFDQVISIEMLEAVGESYWSQYFSKIKSLLKPNGRAGVQVITIDNDDFDRYRSGVDFIQKYIFPGGMLPSDKVMKEQVEGAGMNLLDQTSFGSSYAQTLQRWRERFVSKLAEVKKLGFDDRFVRMWQFYFAYCEAGFKQKRIDVTQYVMG